MFALFLSRGTPTNEAAYPVLEKARVPLIGPSTGAMSMHDPPRRYLFPVRPSYHSETFKIIAQLTAAAEKDGTTITASLRDEMTKLGERAGAAADALAKARETSNIDFGRKTAFLSQEDVAIATELKGIYGNDIPAALNSTYAAGIRVNNAFKEVSSSIESNLTSGLTDITTGAKSAGMTPIWFHPAGADPSDNPVITITSWSALATLFQE